MASDLDDNTILEYTILEGNPNSTFIIGEYTGILSVGNPTSLDYEKNSEFILKIQVSDNQADKSKISEANIKININDLNEYAPVLEDHLFEIEEFPGNDSLIGEIDATDLDLKQSLVFSIESGNEDHSIAIDSLTGEIFVADSSQFDRNINQLIRCLISVSDNHPTQPKKDNALLTIDIKEGNIQIVSISGNVQKGPFIQGSVITVSELNQKMELTGRTFYTNITDNS